MRAIGATGDEGEGEARTPKKSPKMQAYELRDTSLHGKSLFATQNWLQTHSKPILTDSPIMVIPRDSVVFSDSNFKKLSILVRAVAAKNSNDVDQQWKVVEEVTTILLYYYATLEERIMEGSVHCKVPGKENHNKEMNLEGAKELANDIRNYIDGNFFASTEDDWYLSLCQQLIQRVKHHIPLFQQFDADKLVKLLLIYATNAHEFETEPSESINGRLQATSRAWLGLYPLGSKVAHSCKPNLVHVWDNNDPLMRIQFFALNDIKTGEELTMSYAFGDDHRAVWDRVRRREKLKGTKWFGCDCVRCHEEALNGDENRRMKCPKCWKDACLVFSFDVGKPNNDKVTPEKPWYCSACHVTLADDEMPLDVELELYAHLEELAHFLESMSTMDSVNRADAWTSLLADMQMVNKHSVEHLGWQHWCTAWTIPFLAVKCNRDSGQDLPMNKRLKATRDCARWSMRWLRWAETHVGRWLPHVFVRYLVSQSKHVVDASRAAGKLDEERVWEQELVQMMVRFKPYLRGIFCMNDFEEVNVQEVDVGQFPKSQQRLQLDFALEMVNAWEKSLEPVESANVSSNGSKVHKKKK